MVEWKANGHLVTLESDGQLYVVRGPSGDSSARNLRSALGRVAEQLHRCLAGAHGLGGWSLTLQVDGVTAGYGDAVVRGGRRTGPVSETLGCASRIFEANLGPHAAVQNSIEIVASCWEVRVGV